MDHQAVWYPDERQKKETRLYAWMEQLGFSSYEDFHHASVEDLDWFWREAEKALGISWMTPYKEAVNLDNGKMWPQWFNGGTLNIYDNAIGKWAKSEKTKNLPALQWEGEEGGERSSTFSEVAEACERCAAGLKREGINKGDVVGIYMPMIPETVITMLAAAKIGAIIVPMFSGYGSEAVAARLNASKAKMLITANGYYRRGKEVLMLEEAKRAAQLTETVSKIVVVRRLPNKNIPDNDLNLTWEELCKGKGSVETEAMQPSEPLMLLYTSGTTGNPKGTVHTHAGFPIKAAFDAAFSMDVKQSDRVFWFTDMGWMMGPFLVFGALVNGAAVFLFDGSPDYPNQRRLWTLTADHKVTHLGISPTLIKGMMRHGEEALPSREMEHLRVMASTGEPWNPEPWKWLFTKIGNGKIPIINYSGGTEISGGILTNILLHPITPITFNTAMLGMAANVYDPSGNAVRDEIGELVIEQPWVGMTNGFWKEPKRYEDTYWSRYGTAWMHGDWVICDANGYWTITGRSDDIINVAGKRLGPAELESVLIADENVVEAGVVGMPDAMKGEVPVAFIVTKNDVDHSSLMKRVEKHLGKALRPKKIHEVSDLPKTRNAKVMRRVLKAAYLQEDIGSLDALVNPHVVNEIEKLNMEPKKQ